MTELSKRVSLVNPDSQLLALLILFYSCTLAFLPTGGGDLLFWAKWASTILKHGLGSVYGRYISPETGKPTDFLYGPTYMYILFLFGKWQGSVYTIYLNIHQIKAMHLVFDMLGIWYAIRFIQESADRLFYALLLMFNISLLYNSALWGQTDGMLACLILIALYYALRQKVAVSVVVFALALFIKPQPIIFLPLLGLLWLSTCLQKPFSYTLKNSLLVLLSVTIVLSPFLIAGTFNDYVTMQLEITEAYPVVTVNAANLWTVLLPGNTDTIPDKVVRFGLSYHQWGLVFFLAGYLVILFPILRRFYQIQTGKQERFDTSTVLLVSGLVPLVFYFFNTQMHERYAHTSVLLLGAYALSSRNFTTYVIVSVANFWIMNHFLKAINVGWFNTIPLEYVALLFFLALSWGIVQLYRQPMLSRLKTASISIS